jgi:hypothetical protein
MRRWWLGAGAVLLVVSCTDEAVPTPNDSGNGGNGAGGDGAGAIAADCGAICGRAMEVTCEDETCAPQCVLQHDSEVECQQEFAADIACLAAHVAEVFYPCTERPVDCLQVHDDYLACLGGDKCSPVECPMVCDDGCSCRAICLGRVIEQTCTTNEDGTADCICTEDGVLRAECPGSPTSCSAFFVGCCASVVM